MCGTNLNYDDYTFSKQDGYDEKAVRKEFSGAVPLKTLVIYCYDPRAVGVPDAVAKKFGETYPGTIITDEAGQKVASSASMFNVIVAGGRAVDAQRSVTVAQHLFGIENIIVVHHTHCGATSFTADGIIEAHRVEQGADISDFYQRESISIWDHNEALAHDVNLLRNSPGVPTSVNIYGCMYDIHSEELEILIEDKI